MDYIAQLKNDEGYYYGCIDVSGHYLFNKHHQRLGRSSFWSNFCNQRDDLLTPVFNKSQGKHLLHCFDGFNILAFHDYTIDSRPGSNSMFIFPDYPSFAEILELANKTFPFIMQRPLKLGGI